MASRSKLDVCGSCGGFVPSAAAACVHCNASRRPLFERLRIGALGGAFGGGAIAFTLMACYGMPPCEDGSHSCHDFDADAGTELDAARDAKRPDVQIRDAAAGDASDDGGEGDAGDGGDDPDAGDGG